MLDGVQFTLTFSAGASMRAWVFEMKQESVSPAAHPAMPGIARAALILR
jgi:hypothetical protein